MARSSSSATASASRPLTTRSDAWAAARIASISAERALLFLVLRRGQPGLGLLDLREDLLRLQRRRSPSAPAAWRLPRCAATARGALGVGGGGLLVVRAVQPGLAPRPRRPPAGTPRGAGRPGRRRPTRTGAPRPLPGPRRPGQGRARCAARRSARPVTVAAATDSSKPACACSAPPRAPAGARRRGRARAGRAAIARVGGSAFRASPKAASVSAKPFGPAVQLRRARASTCGDLRLAVGDPGGPAAGTGGGADVLGVLLAVPPGGDAVRVAAVGADHGGRGEQLAVERDRAKHRGDPAGGHRACHPRARARPRGWHPAPGCLGPGTRRPSA